MPRKKSKKLKQLEDKLKIIKKEIASRKKSNSTSATSAKSKRNRKSTKSVFEECQTLLEKIKKIQYSKAFLESVDWKALNIPTYPQIIKHPMDLHTIESNLINSRYQNPYQFANDMRLVYQNATTFNKPGTQYYTSATKFAKKFEEEFERKIVDQHENNDFTRKIHKVVSALIKREDSIPFRAPVNPQVLEIPDYLDVIDTPMDLGTILNKIHLYTHFKRFVHDLFLVWDNCCRYNPKQNQIHQTALKLREYTQKQLNRYCQSDFQLWQEDDAASHGYNASTLMIKGDSIPKTEPINSATTSYSGTQTTLAPGPIANLPSDSEQNMSATMDRNTYDEANEVDQEMQQTIVSDDIFKTCDEMEDEEEANKMMIGYLVKKDELNPELAHSLDFHQKEELQRGIQCLDSDHFDPLINMLQSFIPEGEGEDDEVELDVDSIDDALQVKMYNYMLQAIHQQEDERIKREGGNTSSMSILASNTNNGMDIDTHDSHSDVLDIIHQNGKGGIHNANHNNHEVQNEQQMNDMNMSMNMSEEAVNEVEVEMVNQVQNTEIPNVVTSFPTTTAIPSIPQNMPSVEAPPERNDDSNVVNGNNMYTFDAMHVNNEEEEEEEQDNDIEMGMNIDTCMDAHMQQNENANQVNEGHDIIADIENVVETNVNDSLSMPVLEESNHEEEEDEHKMESNDNDVTDNEIQAENVANNVMEVAIIPTMPVLSAGDDDDEDDHKIEKEKEENENVNIADREVASTELQTTETILTIETVTENAKNEDNQIVNDNENVNENENENENDKEEHEEVDTPLADDIDF